MKEKYKDAVRESIEIIREGIKKDKDTRFIKDEIYYKLREFDICKSSIDSFDKYHFRTLTGQRISSYIRTERMEYATEKYKYMKKKIRERDTFCNVSRFKKKFELQEEGKTMKKYMITDMFRMEENIKELSDEYTNDDMLIVEATSKDEATLKYLQVKLESEPQGILKEMLFRDFWVSVGYGEYDYVDDFKNSEQIIALADRIYTDHFADETDPEALYLTCDTDALADIYWSYLHKEDIEIAYYMCNRCEVFCVELKTLAKYKKRVRDNQKNIIEDITNEDIQVWNAIAELMRKENKTEYTLSTEILERQGFDKEEANVLLNYCISNKLKCQVHITYENGSFVYARLAEIKPEKWDADCNNIVIYPYNVLHRLVAAGYDFGDGKNDIAAQALRAKN